MNATDDTVPVLVWAAQQAATNHSLPHEPDYAAVESWLLDIRALNYAGRR
jgi:hypothetical protein